MQSFGGGRGNVYYWGDVKMQMQWPGYPVLCRELGIRRERTGAYRNIGIEETKIEAADEM